MRDIVASNIVEDCFLRMESDPINWKCLVLDDCHNLHIIQIDCCTKDIEDFIQAKRVITVVRKRNSLTVLMISKTSLLDCTC